MRLVRMDAEFFIFVVVGFVAQLIDGALGMAFGVVSATVLLTFGFSPAHASAIVHTPSAVMRIIELASISASPRANSI